MTDTASVDIHVEPPTETSNDAPDVVVVDTGDNSGPDYGFLIGQLTERMTNAEQRIDEIAATATVAEVVADSAADAAAAAADAAATAVEIAETEPEPEPDPEPEPQDKAPGKTHWFNRSFAEWRGKE